MASKLARLGADNREKGFRGNIMFASSHHLQYGRPTRLDDIYSLACVAYSIINYATPW